MWENTTPSTELPRVFCAGIGPLQLGVVLVLIISRCIYKITLKSEKLIRRSRKTIYITDRWRKALATDTKKNSGTLGQYLSKREIKFQEKNQRKERIAEHKRAGKLSEYLYKQASPSWLKKGKLGFGVKTSLVCKNVFFSKMTGLSWYRIYTRPKKLLFTDFTILPFNE